MSVKRPGTVEIDWRDGRIPVSRRFDDPYFSVANGLAESRHVFLAGNDLPGRFAPGFHIAELGFGSGLNMLAAWSAWRESGQNTPLRFTSFEAFPMTPEDIAKALSAFSEIKSLVEEFLASWQKGVTNLSLDRLSLSIIIGDARKTLPRWQGHADAWFLDGFSPAKNPELWQTGLMNQVAAHTASGGTFATYTAAGHVRRSLTQAGFATHRLPGYGTKRHMSVGILAGNPKAAP
jgi:tRNA U34 5-methylaminomethyl-2-thiouridine-forming methyltransferase MnmC